jgi:hypothetical protein
MDGEIDAYSTHQPVLVSALLQTTGSVIEFGTGNYSTPLLHQLCHNRPLLSIDAEPTWLNQFLYLQTGKHEFFLVRDHLWEQANEKIRQFIELNGLPDVVLIDNGDLDYRVYDIKLMANLAKFIVVHDSNVKAYGYEPEFAKFKYFYEYTPEVIHTVVVSNFAPFELLAKHQPKVR